MRGARFAAFAAVAVASTVLLAACGGADATGGKTPATGAATTQPSPTRTAAPPPEAGTPVPSGATQERSTATVIAKDITFDQSQLNLRAGEDTITFRNEDARITHDFAVYADAGYTQLVGATAIMTGPATERLPLTLRPGTYYYRCDVHPQQMHGTIAVVQ